MPKGNYPDANVVFEFLQTDLPNLSGEFGIFDTESMGYIFTSIECTKSGHTARTGRRLNKLLPLKIRATIKSEGKEEVYFGTIVTENDALDYEDTNKVSYEFHIDWLF